MSGTQSFRALTAGDPHPPRPVLRGDSGRGANLGRLRRRPRMKPYNTPLHRCVVIACLTAGVLGVGGSPVPAQAVEREGTTLFLSFAEVQAALRFPPSLLFAPG